MNQRENALRNIILRAGHKCIGMKQLRTRKGEVLNEDIEQEIKEMNELRSKDIVDSEAVQAKEDSVRKMTKEAKEKSWSDTVNNHGSLNKM